MSLMNIKAFPKKYVVLVSKVNNINMVIELINIIWEIVLN